MAPFIQNRATITNFRSISEEEVDDEEEHDDSEVQINDHDNDNDNDLFQESSDEVNQLSPSHFKSTNPSETSKVTGRPKHIGRRKKQKFSKDELSAIDKKECHLMDVIEKKLSEPKTEDSLYGELLSKKLSKLPIELNMQAKHEIDNVMFKFSVLSINYKQPVMNQQFLSQNITDFSKPASPQGLACMNQPKPANTIYKQNVMPSNLPIPEFRNRRIHISEIASQESQPNYTVGTTFMNCLASKEQGQQDNR